MANNRKSKNIQCDFGNSCCSKSDCKKKFTSNLDDKKMIIVCGKQNAGKTTAIELIFTKIFLKLGEENGFKDFNYSLISIATIGKDLNDFMVVVDIEINGKKYRLIIYSVGDDLNSLAALKDAVKNLDCDVIICAARTLKKDDGAVLKDLEAYANEAKIKAVAINVPPKIQNKNIDFSDYKDWFSKMADALKNPEEIETILKDIIYIRK